MNGKILHDPKNKDCLIHSPDLDLENSRVGGFDFEIKKDHYLFSEIKQFKSWVTIFENEEQIYKGRILDFTEDIFGNLEVTTEGELGILNDSIQVPHQRSQSLRSYVQWLLTNHNSRCQHNLRIGTFTMSGNVNIKNEDFKKTWSIIEELQANYGGYLSMENEVLTWITENDLSKSNQQIRLGRNLTEYDCEFSGSEIVNAVIPMGNKSRGISSVNGGSDALINQESVNEFGYIWDYLKVNSDSPSEIKAEAQRFLDVNSLILKSINLSAFDLSVKDDFFKTYKKGDIVEVVIQDKDLVQEMIIQKVEIPLDRPFEKKIFLGNQRRELTGLKQDVKIGTTEVLTSEIEIIADNRIYDSKIITDPETGKKYQWTITLIDGKPEIEIEEVM